MNITPLIALSGMRAAQTQLQVSAHNIANTHTGGFRRQQVQAAAVSGGGVTTSLAQASPDTDSLESDMIGLLQAKSAFLANLAVFRSSDRMTGALLDTMG